MSKKEILAIRVDEKLKERIKKLQLGKRVISTDLRKTIESTLLLMEAIDLPRDQKIQRFKEAIEKLSDVVSRYVALAQEEKQWVRILKVLKETPHKYYHDGSLGVSDSGLEVTAILNDGREIKLTGRYSWGSNYAYEQPRQGVFGDLSEEFAELPTIAQLSYIYKEMSKGKPFKVNAKFWDVNDWPGQELKQEKWEVEFDFPLET